MLDASSTTVTLHADGTVTIEGKQGITVDAATSKLELKGADVSIEATGQLTLKGGMASLQGDSMTEVKGQMVKIN